MLFSKKFENFFLVIALSAVLFTIVTDADKPSDYDEVPSTGFINFFFL